MALPCLGDVRKGAAEVERAGRYAEPTGSPPATTTAHRNISFDLDYSGVADDVFPPETKRFNVSVGYLRSYKPYGNFTVEATACGARHVLALSGHWDLPYTLAQNEVVVPRTACKRVRVTVVPTSPAPANSIVVTAFRLTPVF